VNEDWKELGRKHHNHHISDTKLLPNTSNINKVKAQSHTYKPTKHILHQYKIRKNTEKYISVEDTHLHTTTASRQTYEHLLHTFNVYFNDLTS
jgi:hypothetical protein